VSYWGASRQVRTNRVRLVYDRRTNEEVERKNNEREGIVKETRINIIVKR